MTARLLIVTSQCLFSAGHCTFCCVLRCWAFPSPWPSSSSPGTIFSDRPLCLPSDMSCVTQGPCLLVTRTSTVGWRAHRPPSNSLLCDTALNASCKWTHSSPQLHEINTTAFLLQIRKRMRTYTAWGRGFCCLLHHHFPRTGQRRPMDARFKPASVRLQSSVLSPWVLNNEEAGPACSLPLAPLKRQPPPGKCSRMALPPIWGQVPNLFGIASCLSATPSVNPLFLKFYFSNMPFSHKT